jgi:Zn-dependent peptidase ImmA (M78 family)
MDFGNWGPQRWAIHLTQLLNAANPPDRYRFDLARLTVEFTRTVFPQDPILRVEETDLDGFEGALLPSESGKRWGILCARGRSPGRRRFTLAHEFGHYLLHRKRFPEGFRCTETSVDARDGVEIEREANDFASTLLMPLDDFRARVPATAVPGFNELSDCASRYEVSLSAAILRWLRYTDRRAMIAVSPRRLHKLVVVERRRAKDRQVLPNDEGASRGAAGLGRRLRYLRRDREKRNRSAAGDLVRRESY